MWAAISSFSSWLLIAPFPEGCSKQTKPEVGGPSLGSNMVSLLPLANGYRKSSASPSSSKEGQWISLSDGRSGKGFEGFEAVFNSLPLWLDCWPVWGFSECKRRGCSSPGGALGHLPRKASKPVREISGSGVSSLSAPRGKIVTCGRRVSQTSESPLPHQRKTEFLTAFSCREEQTHVRPSASYD